MSLTIEQVARRALSTIDTDAGFLLAVQWVSKRFNQLVGRHRFRSLKRIVELVVPQLEDTGTVSITQNTRTVTGNSTAQDSWDTKNLVGRYIRVGSGGEFLYQIIGQSGATLTLESNFVESTVAAGGSYEILSRFLTLPTNVRWFGQISGDNYTLTNISYELMNELVVGRERTGSPRMWAEAPPDSDGRKRIEIYPVPVDEDFLLRLTYWPGEEELKADDYIPDFLPYHILESGVLIDLYRYEMAKSMRMGDVNAASLWRNESRSQETVWRRVVEEASNCDRGVEDVEMLLSRGSLSRPFEITNAREEIVARLR